MRFLVVDDSPTMRRIVINALKTIGFQTIVEAENGCQGLEKLETEQIDFVITDWNMPAMSGLDMTIAIRADEKTKNIPILMITTRGNKEDILSALKAKVNNYLVKPFTPEGLKEKINAISNLIR